MSRLWAPTTAAAGLRVMTAGSVDCGKSTLLGRLLWDCGSLPTDVAVAGPEDLADLIDGLAAEREQGITIDVAHRQARSASRRFVFLDAPGHEEYTRNMATAASTAHVAVILVDAAEGIVTQTRRHTGIVAEMGVGNVLLAVNKMDAVGFDEDRYRSLATAFEELATRWGIPAASTLPVSGLLGDHVVTRSAAMPWFTGPTLLEWLESAEPRLPDERVGVFPVQWVGKDRDGRRVLAGTPSGAELRVGDSVRVVRSGRAATVATVHRAAELGKPVPSAAAGAPVSIVLDHHLDVACGDVLVPADPVSGGVRAAGGCSANLVWLADEPAVPGRAYEVKLAGQWSAATITGVAERVDLERVEHVAATTVEPNDLALVELSLATPLLIAPYRDSRRLGAFLLVDRRTHATVAAGMVRATRPVTRWLYEHEGVVDRAAQAALKGHPGRVVWLTGLSGAGKSTIADVLIGELHRRGVHTALLDGDNLRSGLNADLGFGDEDRVENVRRTIEVARLMVDAGLVVVVALISPFRAERAMARERIGAERFVEVFVDTPLGVCEQRDTKGLYRRARAGEIADFTGISSPYEPPERAEVTIDGTCSPGELAAAVEGLCAVLTEERRV